MPLRRHGLRLRLAALYSALSLVSGAALLAVTYVLFAHAPVTELRHRTIGPGGGAGSGGPGRLPPIGSPAATQRSADLHHLIVQSALALAIMTVLSTCLGWLLAGRMLRPLRAITATTRRLSAGNLHQRLALPGPADELKDLADTIDDLLGRLERSFTAQRQFVAHASHELRTPLALSHAVLEAALTDPRPSTQSWRAACTRALAAGAEQGRLIDALLTLARSEAGLDRCEEVDLAATAAQVLAGRHELAGRRGLRVGRELAPARVTGDPRLIERLIANLVDNAIQHNVHDGWITVRAATRDGAAVLAVANGGRVIPAGDVARLLQPFQRTADRRTHHDGGFGLGLSIVEAIATAHGAALRVRPPAEGGLEITVTFPRHGR